MPTIARILILMQVSENFRESPDHSPQFIIKKAEGNGDETVSKIEDKGDKDASSNSTED